MELISPDNPSFKASSGWMDKFMLCHSLSLRWGFVIVHVVYYSCYFFFWSYRAKTSIQQKLPAELEEKLEKFISNIKVLRETHTFPKSLIINMDETPVYYDMPASTTVNKKGCREVRIRSTGTEKRRFTVIWHALHLEICCHQWLYSKEKERSRSYVSHQVLWSGYSPKDGMMQSWPRYGSNMFFISTPRRSMLCWCGTPSQATWQRMFLKSSEERT